MFFYMLFALVLAIVIASTTTYQFVSFKLRLFAHGIRFMYAKRDAPAVNNRSNVFLSSDSSIAHSTAYVDNKRTIRVIFVRHGQSMWNSLFNAFGLMWPVRVARALVTETMLLFTDPFDSTLIDSPLSERGKREADELASSVRASTTLVSISPSSSVIVTSNLRRAMETALTGFAMRVRTTRERIVVDSSLCEGTNNIDSQTFSSEQGMLAPVRLGSVQDVKQLARVFDPAMNDGAKVIGEDVYARMDVFLQRLFGLPSCENSNTKGKDGSPHLRQDALRIGFLPAVSNPVGTTTNADLREIIVVGHSVYFRNFFNRFLPANSTHVARQKKMENCGVVLCEVTHDRSTGVISVDESSIQCLCRGFK